MIQATGDFANKILDGLRATPALLLLVILNGMFLAAAGWFLLKQEEYRHMERLELATILKSCMRVPN
jgi:hypothetical protein